VRRDAVGGTTAQATTPPLPWLRMRPAGQDAGRHTGRDDETAPVVVFGPQQYPQG